MDIKNTSKGFTLLELIITLAIIGVLYAVSTKSVLTGWDKEATTENTYKILKNRLVNIKNHALSKSTTTKMVIDSSYQLTTYYSETPTDTCSNAGTWNNIANEDLEVHKSYNISGTAYSSPVCFFRDGSSTGGTLIIAPNQEDEGKTYRLNIAIATSYIDVIED